MDDPQRRQPARDAGRTLPAAGDAVCPSPICTGVFSTLRGAVLAGGRLNRLRASLGLKPVRRMFRWWFSPQRILGFFPDWYGRPAADWPAQMRLIGFPNYDGRPAADLPADVQEFCGAGPPPVAFTFGTGMMHATEFFRAALKACRLLGVRGLFLTKYTRQLPSVLPPFVLHCPFAPFQELFRTLRRGGPPRRRRHDGPGAGRRDAAAGPAPGLRSGRQRGAGEEPRRGRLAQRPPSQRRPHRSGAGPHRDARGAGALPAPWPVISAKETAWKRRRSGWRSWRRAE